MKTPFNFFARRSGFTLIELLIVVAIIAILAAIAVPNFLEAQTRAKVSRAQSDMRTIATALESYAVDNNSYPQNYRWTNRYYLYVPYNLTSPIAYLSGEEVLYDNFREGNNQVFFAQTGSTNPNFTQRYIYFNTEMFSQLASQFTLIDTSTGNQYIPRQQTVQGAWQLSSFGPDLRYGPEVPVRGGAQKTVIYDPTNGTVSFGDIVRTQRDPLGLDTQR
jgi:prepilin-type N-terminal cleavage/methylation domain-containing protein